MTRRLVNALETRPDFYTQEAARMFGVWACDVTPDQRAFAKGWCYRTAYNMPAGTKAAHALAPHLTEMDLAALEARLVAFYAGASALSGLTRQVGGTDGEA